MYLKKLAVAVSFLLFSCAAFGQQAATSQAGTSDSSASSANTTTIRGCLSRSRGNYLVVENKTGLVYVLQGVGDKLDSRQGQTVEVTGQSHPGSIKTGVRSAKSGSNPSDAVHGVDGVPLRVADVNSDVKTISKKCTAADAE